MKVKLILLAFYAFLMVGCNAQTTAIALSNTVKGNTGHRGILPPEERNKPLEGKDYYNCTLTIKQNCTLEIVHLTVKKDGGQINLLPKLDNGLTKKKVKKGDVIYLNVEKDKNYAVAKPSIKGEGNLVVKINGKLTQIPIKEFTMILPM